MTIILLFFFHRWASAGMEFLKLVCAPRLLATVTQTQFEELKKLINRCLDHMTETRPLNVEASKSLRQTVPAMVLLYCSCNCPQAHSQVFKLKIWEWTCMGTRLYLILLILLLLTVAYKQRRPWTKKLDLGRKGFSQGKRMCTSVCTVCAQLCVWCVLYM